ncbi:hypothetical protein Bpfe_030298, partial [Biomphalaria pfeifferi]
SLIRPSDNLVRQTDILSPLFHLYRHSCILNERSGDDLHPISKIHLGVAAPQRIFQR